MNASSPAIRFGLASLLAFALVGAQIGCATEPRVRVRQSDALLSEPHSTFAYVGCEDAPGGFKQTKLSAEVERETQTLVRNELLKRGYREESRDKADLLLVVGAGRRNSEHTPSGPPAVDSDDVFDDDVTEGRVVLDVFDQKTPRPVWHGQVTRRVEENKVQSNVLANSVSDLMQKFPSASPSLSSGSTAPATPAPATPAPATPAPATPAPATPAAAAH